MKPSRKLVWPIVIVLAWMPTLAWAAAEIADDDQLELALVVAKQPMHVRIHLRRGDKSYRAHWRDQLAQVFAQLDSNKNQSLDEAEYDAGPWFSLRVAGGVDPPAAPTFADADIDPNDGGISFEELCRQLAPLSASIIARTAESRARGAVDALFKRLDGNRDSRLSQLERRDLFVRLKRYDRNDDELLSLSEVQGSADSATPSQRRNEEGSRDREIVVAAAPGESNDGLARRLFVHYDLDGNRRLDRNEFRLPGEEFAHADADGDLLLSPGEVLLWFGRHRPDGEILVAFDNAGNLKEARLLENEAPVAGPASTPKIAAELRLRWQENDLLIRIRSRRSPDLESEVKKSFAGLDRDHNGYLDRAEMDQTGYRFEGADRDFDDKVFIQELLAAARLQQEISAARTALVVSQRGGSLFNVLDANGDRLLSRRELKNLESRIADADLNADSDLSASGIRGRYEITIQCGGDFAGDPALATKAAYEEEMTPSPSAKDGPAWFVRMDRNGDGDVSRREYLGPRRLFDKLDQDGDELIDPTEANAANTEEKTSTDKLIGK